VDAVNHSRFGSIFGGNVATLKLTPVKRHTVDVRKPLASGTLHNGLDPVENGDVVKPLAVMDCRGRGGGGGGGGEGFFSCEGKKKT